jgi:isoleucyl-tRNA synthetase
MNKQQLPSQPDLPQMEQEVAEFWQKNQAFKKQVEMRSKDKAYIFYDGPPFATGLPHYGHLLGSTSKDVIPRYWAMKGYRVERVWGWDCHGLPIENMIEKKLQIKGGKKGIEEMGIDKFNAACRSEVLRLDTEWEKIINRLGRWVDFENNYKTMDNDYMESVWWGFGQLYQKELIYQGRKVVMYCPRCATPLSNFEIAMDNSYEDTEDWSIFVKFKIEKSAKSDKNEYLIAWTTTPWTLPGNVALAVDPKADYVQVQSEEGELLWLAASLKEKVLGHDSGPVLQTLKGAQLVGTKYQPLYPYLEKFRTDAAWTVLAGDFVSLEDGTGVVHTAAMFGEDDYELALQENLPLVNTMDENGKFLDFVELVAGKFYKSAEEAINKDLSDRKLVFKLEKFVHSYPFCYRCSTPLYYNAVPAWFINVQKLKPKLLANNENMNWFPDHLKHGRFGKGLETAPDWNISRSRYWGTPMPVWKDEKSGNIRVISSREELKKWAVDPSAVDKLADLHREFLDPIEVWVDDQKTIKGQRITEVFDCWVESGSMPFAQLHYPFKNKEKFEKTYPAQFVSEYIAQTRAWFYCMHVISVGIFDSHAADNTLTTGTILAEDGNKMSKSKNNYPDPMLLIDKYGVDSLRLYLMSSSVMRAENLNFSEKAVADVRKNTFLIWYNLVKFYDLYAKENKIELNKTPECTDVMDKWILSYLNSTILDVTKAMDNYNVVKATRLLMSFSNQLSTWYLRRSRERLRNVDGNQAAAAVFGYVLVKMAQLFAPFTPFFSEWVFHQLVDNQASIHHTDWPVTDSSQINTQLEQQMLAARQSVEKILAARSEAGIKVRQPLSSVTVYSSTTKPNLQVLQVLMDEVNVKKVVWNTTNNSEVPADEDEDQVKLDSNTKDSSHVELDTVITPELKEEGDARDLMRQIQKLRQQAGLSLADRAKIVVPSWPKKWQKEIETKTNSQLMIGDELSLIE